MTLPGKASACRGSWGGGCCQPTTPLLLCCRSPLEPGTEAPRPVPVLAVERGLPLTGLQAAEVFARNWHVGKIQFLYFNVALNRHFR